MAGFFVSLKKKGQTIVNKLMFIIFGANQNGMFQFIRKSPASLARQTYWREVRSGQPATRAFYRTFEAVAKAFPGLSVSKALQIAAEPPKSDQLASHADIARTAQIITLKSTSA